METPLSTATIEKFQSSLSAQGKSPQTVRAYGLDLMSLLIFSGQSELSPTLVESLASTFLNQTRNSVAASTTARRLASLRAYGKFCKTDLLSDYKAPTPAKGIPHPLPGGIADVHAILRQCRTHERSALVALCGLQGLRISEAREVRPSDFNLDRMLLTVRGKGSKVRVIPLSVETYEFCRMAYMQAVEFNTRLVVMADRSARTAITTMARAAGIDRPVASHDLRATFATDLHNKCLNIRVVQDFLGHASVETTQLYTGVKMDSMRQALEA